MSKALCLIGIHKYSDWMLIESYSRYSLGNYMWEGNELKSECINCYKEKFNHGITEGSNK